MAIFFELLYFTR